MAYNLAPFNRTPFNIGSDSEIWLSVLFAEKVTPVIGTSSETYLLALGGEKILRDQILGGNGIYVALPFEEEISKDIPQGMYSIVMGETVFAETVSNDLDIQCDIYPHIEGSETVDFPESSYIGATIYPGKAKGAEVINEEVVTDKESWLIVGGYERVSSSVTLEAVDIYTCYLNVTLKPGDVLVVDAINYNVWLNNENANWILSGEWIDELARETSSISVEANIGGSELSASILYTERYL